MKKFIAIICTLALLTAITGCNNDDTSESVPDNGGSVSAPESTDNTSDKSDSFDSSENSESAPESSDSVPEQRLSDEQLEMIAGLTMQSLVGPDGETVLMTDAVDAVRDKAGGIAYDQTVETLEMITWVDTMLTFDFAYIRYARPYFYAGEPIEDEEREPLPETKWFKVREGDKLDCGLTVKKAQFEMYPVLGWEHLTHLQTIELDGEITLEGMLFATTNPNDYASKVGDLNFYPDPTITESIPVVRHDHDRDEVWYNLNQCLYPSAEPEYFETDASPTWYIGNIDDDNFDESSIFGSEKLVRVKTTLKNVKLDVFDEFAGGGFSGAEVTAEIVGIERID